MISVRRPAFIARSTLPDRWQTISRWPHHLSCSCRVQKDRDEGIYFYFFFSSLFPSTSLISLSRHGGAERQKTATWLSMAPARSASRPKANEEWGAGAWGGGGKWTRRETIQKICTYRVSVSRSRLGKRWGFSIMDKLLIRWELGLFLWLTLPPPNSPLSIHPSLLPIHCHPSCLLPIQDMSHFPWLDSYIRNAQKNLASFCGQNATLHLNYLIDFLAVYCFVFFPTLLLIPFIFLFIYFFFSFFTGLIICSMGHRMKTHTHTNTLS